MSSTDEVKVDLEAELTAYLDGELSAEARARVEQALASDASLRARLSQLEAAFGAVKALPEPVVSPQLRRAVLAHVAEPTWRERLAALLSPRRLVPVGAVAAVALAVWVNRQGPPASDAQATPVVADDEALAMATNLELLEDMELAGLERAEDLDVVTQLQELEATP